MPPTLSGRLRRSSTRLAELLAAGDALGPTAPLEELYQEAADPLQELRARLGNDDPFEDDQYLLRMLLDKDLSVSKAESEAKVARDHRNNFAEVLEFARSGQAPSQEALFRPLCCQDRWRYPRGSDDCNGAVAATWPTLLVTRIGQSDFYGCFEAGSEDDLLRYLLWLRVRMYFEAHRATEATGRIHMMTTVNDFADASFQSVSDKKVFRVLKRLTKTVAALAPYFIRKHIMINAPSKITKFIQFTMWGLAKTGVPQRVLDKVTFTSALEEIEEILGVPSSMLPEFLGGGCPVPPDSALADPSRLTSFGHSFCSARSYSFLTAQGDLPGCSNWRALFGCSCFSGGCFGGYRALGSA